jgi:hypothetical protein
VVAWKFGGADNNLFVPFATFCENPIRLNLLHHPREGLLDDPRLGFVVPPAIDLGVP